MTPQQLIDAAQKKTTTPKAFVREVLDELFFELNYRHKDAALFARTVLADYKLNAAFRRLRTR